MESSDDIEVLTLKKFRGDLAYRRQEYEVGVNTSQTLLLQLGSLFYEQQQCVWVSSVLCGMDLVLSGAYR